MTAIADPESQLAQLKQVVNVNKYSPAFNPLQNGEQWEEVYCGLARLVLIDPKLAAHIVKISGQPFGKINLAVFNHIIQNEEISSYNINTVLEHGFSMDKEVVVGYMITMDPATAEGASFTSILKDVVEPEQLDEYAREALCVLFQNYSTAAIRIADHLITTFDIQEKTVGRALYPTPDAVSNGKLDKFRDLPLFTVFGMANGGMSDSFWAFLLARYGAAHPFIDSCLADLIIGGTIPTSPPADLQQSQAWWQGTATHTLTSEREAATRESMAVIFDLGCGYYNTTFIIICDLILTRRQVAIRYIDYYVRLEKHLFSCSAEERKTWTSTINDIVVQNQDWISNLPQTESSGTYIGGLMDSVRSIKLDGSGTQGWITFYQKIKMLATSLGSESQDRPFHDWINGIDAEANFKSLNTKRSWGSSWFS